MTYTQYLYHVFKTSKVLPIVFIIACTCAILMILVGPTLVNNDTINILLWITYIIIPTSTNILGSLYLEYKQQENNIYYKLSLIVVSYLILVFILSILHPIDINIITTSAIVYGTISFCAFLSANQISKIESLLQIEKKYCPEILKHIPLPKRGDLWALEANDHYVNIITSKGTYMLYSTLAQAIKQTHPLHGIHIHRSYWVAEKGLKDIKRKNNRTVCVVKNDLEINVSNKGLQDMRKQKWIK